MTKNKTEINSKKQPVKSVCKLQKKILNNTDYTLQEAINELEELKNIALNSFDKYGNPNVVAAIRAVETKAKISGLFNNKNKTEILSTSKMSEITIDGKQLKLKIGEEFSL